MALPARRGNRGTAVRGWDPISELERTAEQMSELLGRGFGGWPDVSSVTDEGFLPLADIEETDDSYLCELELPGVSKDDIDIELHDRRLSVSGERQERERSGVLRRRMRTTGRFYFETTLPGDIEPDNVEASMDNGVLTITVPKAQDEQTRSRRVEIN